MDAMRAPLVAVVLTLGLPCIWAAPALAAGAELDAADVKLMREAGLTLDNNALLAFLRARTLAEIDRTKILALVRQLGDDDFEVRDRSSAQLETLGAPAVPLLRQALRDEDIEIVHRAQKCLQHIEKVAGPAVSCAVARAVAQRKPPGAAATLLAFLPFADDENVAEEVRAALTAVALADGKPDGAILEALNDRLPLKRAAAAEALIRTGSVDQRVAMRNLLKDEDPSVRLRVATALFNFKELEAIPVLIKLLEDLPQAQGRLAEGLLGELAGEFSPNAILGEEEAARAKCRKAWEDWWKTYDGPGLLKYFQELTPTDAERDKMQTWIKQLKADSFEERVKATEELSKCGPAALPLLRRAMLVPDSEAATRAKKALADVEKKYPRTLGGAVGDAARILSLHRPPGAVEVLLTYLPSAEEESVDAIRAALATLAVRDGKVEPALIKALSDPSPERRIGAAVALARGGPAEQRAPVRKLLADDELSVRLPVAQALIPTGDKEAVGTVIDLLLKLPADQIWQAESLLCGLAEDKSPPSMNGTDDKARKKTRDEWTEWWRLNKEKVDLAKLDQPDRLLGFTLVAQLSRGRNGTVMELGRDGKPRWQIDGLNYPMDARMIASDRVLIAEYSGGQVTERNTKGEILWSKRIQFPMACQRLTNGNTFIVTRNQLVEVDRSGKEVLTHARNANDIMAGQKLRNGHMLFVTNAGALVRLDSTGKEIKTINVQPPQIYGSNLEVLPNGRILAPQYANNRVIEYDADGKVVWEATAQQPTSVQRLPNGHTLVSSLYSQLMVELDRQGKEISQTRLDGRVTRVRRR
jgi:HEAT repeat protein